MRKSFFWRTWFSSCIARPLADGAAVSPGGAIRELRHTLGQLRLNALAVGADGRNRCLLSAFQARTGRNQPSNSRYIFGPSCWLRGLIKPERGRAVAYVDWSQQEFGIAAALSGDGAMMEAYSSGDPYLTFAKQAGAVPADATKQSHPHKRGQLKVVLPRSAYCFGVESAEVAENGDIRWPRGGRAAGQHPSSAVVTASTSAVIS